MKNKENTKRKLIEAVGAIIKSEGFNKLGVNKVAKAAGVSKMLIYRYFGGLEQLRKAYISENDFLKKYLSTDPAADGFRHAIHAQVSKILSEQSDEIYSHCEIEALLMDEICNNTITSHKLKRDIPADPTIYFELMSTLLSAGTEQLILNGTIGNQGKKNDQSINQQQDLIQSIEQIVDWTLG